MADCCLCCMPRGDNESTALKPTQKDTGVCCRICCCVWWCLCCIWSCIKRFACWVWRCCPAGDERKQPPGLRNLGNTCYFNAVMQIVYHTPLLQDVLQTDVYDNSLITWAVEDFYDRMIRTERQNRSSFWVHSVNPQLLLNRLSERSSWFHGSRQQDSHELLRHLMDGMRQELKTTQSYERSKLTAVDEVFGGHFLTVFHCHECRMPYHLFEPFLEISLPIAFEDEWEKARNQPPRPSTYGRRVSEGPTSDDDPTVNRYRESARVVQERLSSSKICEHRDTLLNSLLFFTRLEQLDEYFCLNCNEGRTKDQFIKPPATRETTIFNPPAILTIHLKRFEQTEHGFRKVASHIQFDDRLSLAPFCSRFAWRQQPVNSGEESFQYRLYGVVVHGGSLEGGHYTACVRVRTVDVDTARSFLQKTFLDRQEMMTKEQLIQLVAGNLPRERLPYSRPTHEYDRDTSAYQWFEISDTSVRAVSLQDVYRKEAYLLFYERYQ